jgi:CBS domain containing-hemolysin-like protein
MISQIMFFLAALCAAALFAFLETAFTALRLFKLKELQVTVAKYKGLFAVWESNPQRILITILIANNFAHVLASVLISEIMQQYVGDWGLAIGVGVATVTILIFGEIIPKSFAKTHHERLFESFLWLVDILFRIMYPFVTILLKIADIFFRIVGGQHILEKRDNTEAEIKFLIDYSDKKGVMDEEKTEMLQNILGLGHKIVKEIMVPKSEVKLLDVNATLNQAVEIVAESGYSRLPVYEDTSENIVGLIHHKDLLKVLYKKQDKSVRDLILPVLFVPETQKINQLLSELLKKQIHMVIVINEFGEFDGLVTLENIIEEIVGDITDEHEKINADIIPLDKGGWLINAGVSLEELEDSFNIRFPAEESITLAGFLAERLQHLPKKGERIIHEGYCFQVQQANVRRVFQVLMFEDHNGADHEDHDD